MTATDKPARRTVSAEEKAREALGVAQRRVERIAAVQAKAQRKREDLQAKYEAATKPLDAQIANMADNLADAVREVEAYRALVASLTPPLKAAPLVSEPTTTLPGATNA